MLPLGPAEPYKTVVLSIGWRRQQINILSGKIIDCLTLWLAGIMNKPNTTRRFRNSTQGTDYEACHEQFCSYLLQFQPIFGFQRQHVPIRRNCNYLLPQKHEAGRH